MCFYIIKMAKQVIISVPAVQNFVSKVFRKLNVNEVNADQIAEMIAVADYRGQNQEGLAVLEAYVYDLEHRMCEPNAEPRVLSDGTAFAWVDGMKGIGVVVGNYCMKLAIRKARRSGLGFVVCKRSNHFGFPGWYSLIAINHGMIGFAFSNSRAVMNPCGGKEPMLGVNSMAVGSPGSGQPFLLDMDCSTVTTKKIAAYRRKTGTLPRGWPQEEFGRPSEDARVAIKEGCQLPLGGSETYGVMHGFGLALLVEILCSVLSDAAYGVNIESRAGRGMSCSDLGQCFIVIDPESFSSDFPQRFSEFIHNLRSQNSKTTAVTIPGDGEVASMIEVDKRGGVIYPRKLLQGLNMGLAKKLGVTPMQFEEYRD